MKKVLTLTALLLSSQVNAWIEPYSPYGMMPYGGMYGGYGMMYPYPPLQVPSFNYQTTVIQQPAPIIVQEAPRQPEVIYRESPPKVIYKEVEVCNDECERLRGYFRKK
jgi:hypothetical protein